MNSPTLTAGEIAGKLTEAQRNAIKGRILHISKRDPLVAAGILTNDGGRDWTPLGLAVRQHLLESPSNG